MSITPEQNNQQDLTPEIKRILKKYKEEHDIINKKLLKKYESKIAKLLKNKKFKFEAYIGTIDAEEYYLNTIIKDVNLGNYYQSYGLFTDLWVKFDYSSNCLGVKKTSLMSARLDDSKPVIPQFESNVK